MYLEYFVLGGGGSGGWPAAGGGSGGGGAGGLLVGVGNFPIRADYLVVPGAGGVNGGPGGDSAIYYITNWVPGGGAGGSTTGAHGNGGNGGSGGGGTGNYGGWSGGAGTPGQGNNGGIANFGGNLNEGGGGGGFNGVGGNGYEQAGDQRPIGGPGGAAIAHDFSGVGIWYAGGGGGGGGRFGGGGTGSPSPGNASGGNGGTGSQTPGGNYPPSAGIPYSGGGGGGGTENYGGAAGGAGLVMIRYPIPTLGSTLAAGGAIADVAGGWRLHTFYASENFVIIAPTVTSINVASGLQGTVIYGPVVYGTNFTADSSLTIGAGALPVSSFGIGAGGAASWCQFNLTIPAGAAVGDYEVRITNTAGQSAPIYFHVYSGVPTCTGIAPASGFQGTSVPVTIYGSNFTIPTITVAATGMGVSGVAVGADTWLQCTLTIPPGLALGSYPVTVSNANGTSNATYFEVKSSGSGMFIVMGV